MILLDIPPSTTSITVGMLERCGVYLVPAKASAKKKKKSAPRSTSGVLLQ